MNTKETRYNVGELAAELGYHRNYVSAMRRAGFPMPGGRATYREAIEWLAKHKDFRVHKARALRECK